MPLLQSSVNYRSYARNGLSSSLSAGASEIRLVRDQISYQQLQMEDIISKFKGPYWFFSPLPISWLQIREDYAVRESESSRDGYSFIAYLLLSRPTEMCHVHADVPSDASRVFETNNFPDQHDMQPGCARQQANRVWSYDVWHNIGWHGG